MNSFEGSSLEHKFEGSSLEHKVEELEQENMEMRKRMMSKHSLASTRWRNQAFYYKAKARAMEHYLMRKGIEVPNTKELLSGDGEENKGKGVIDGTA